MDANTESTAHEMAINCGSVDRSLLMNFQFKNPDIYGTEMYIVLDDQVFSLKTIGKGFTTASESGPQQFPTSASNKFHFHTALQSPSVGLALI